jgi:hypothetical protein
VRKLTEVATGARAARDTGAARGEITKRERVGVQPGDRVELETDSTERPACAGPPTGRPQLTYGVRGGAAAAGAYAAHSVEVGPTGAIGHRSGGLHSDLLREGAQA